MSLLDVSRRFGLGKYTLGMSSVETMIRARLGTMWGCGQDIIDGQAFYQRDVRSTVRPGAHRVLDEHREQGHLCVRSRHRQTISLTSLALHFAFMMSFVHVWKWTMRASSRTACGATLLWHRQGGSCPSMVQSSWRRFTRPFSIRTRTLTQPAVGYPVCAHDVRLRKLGERRSWPIQYWTTSIYFFSYGQRGIKYLK